MIKDQRDGGTRKSDHQNEHNFRVRALNSEVAELYVSRLAEVLQDCTIPELARNSGVADSALRTYMAGRSLPGWENAVKIARATRRSLDWFASADAVVSYAQQAEADYTAREALQRRLVDFALIPLYDVRASAGHGAWNDEERISKMLAFRRDWISIEIGANPDDLALCYVDGDSMESTIGDGDVVMFDRSQREVRSDDIYVFEQGDQLLIKRLQRVSGGRLRVLSDNARYPPYELSAGEVGDETFPIHIVGRVVWAGVRL